MILEVPTTSVPPPQAVNAAGARQLINAGNTIVIDIRTEQEIAGCGHLKGARRIDFSSPDFAENIAALARNNVYLIYCQSGIRGLRTGMLMEKLGFVHVYILDGGINTWLRAGLPTLHDQQ